MKPDLSTELLRTARLQLATLASPETLSSQIEELARPTNRHPGLDGVMAMHWHPESVPVSIATRRFQALYPDAVESLLIPTQHNLLTGIGGYHGVEVDCRHRGAKLQLLLHFHGSRVLGETGFLADLDRTRAYRARQLDHFLAVLTDDTAKTLRQELADFAGCTEAQRNWLETECSLLVRILNETGHDLPDENRKNKLVRDWLLTRLGGLEHPWAHTLLDLLRRIKEHVKADFALDWFLPAEDWIHRTHQLGGTVTLPHPELFWDTLAAGLPLDGVEIWNPQSCQRSEELLALLAAGRIPGRPGLPILPTFGDDCHLGEKLKPVELQDPEKATREIGLQPAWEWPGIQALLDQAGWRRVELVRLWKRRLST